MADSEWDGDLTDNCSLRVGDLLGHCERSGTLHLNEPPDAERESADYWHCAVDRVGPDGLAIGDPLFDNAETGGFVIGGHLARAICEAVLRQAKRADEAERRQLRPCPECGCVTYFYYNCPHCENDRLRDELDEIREAQDELERLQRQQAALRKELAAAKAIVDSLNALRSEEGASVLIPCDNPDFGGPGCFVEVNSDWTEWVPIRFDGDNLRDVLAIAARAKAAAGGNDG
jgi:hypothetical protein